MTSAVTALSAAYFVRSAIRAWRNLSADQSVGGSGAINEDRVRVASKAMMRRLVRRVLMSGCLTLAITMALAIGANFLFHPIGFTVVFGSFAPIAMANSLLQISSFAPASGAPIGPLHEIKLVVMSSLRHLANRAEQRLASSPSAKPNKIVRIAQHRRLKRASFVDQQGYELFGELIATAQYQYQPAGNDHNEATETRTGRRESLAGRLHDARSEAEAGAAPRRTLERRGSLSGMVHDARSEAEAGTEPTGSEDQVKPWDHLGVSVRCLEAFARTHKVTANMTTTDVMETIIKPETAARKCCYVELVASDDRCPPQWLGKITHFASHW